MKKILSICGSPRKGNSEAILNKLKEIFNQEGIENEIILLREKNIDRCDGCVEFCDKELYCHKQDDMTEILKKMEAADGYVFISPNYFKMPTGLFKDFIDRCSIFYTAKTDLSSKKAIVIAVGADVVEEIDGCLKNMTDNFVKTLGIKIVATKSFQSNSELKGNFNDIFESKTSPNIESDLKEMVLKIKNSLV